MARMMSCSAPAEQHRLQRTCHYRNVPLRVLREHLRGGSHILLNLLGWDFGLFRVPKTLAFEASHLPTTGPKQSMGS